MTPLQNIQRSGLIAHHPLNKDARDYSGSGNHGVVTGATLVAHGGVDGTGHYSFDGVNGNFIRASHQPKKPQAHTISGWFLKRAHCTTRYPIFLSYGLPYIACNGDGHPFRVSYKGEAQVNTEGGVVPVLNRWYHVCAVFDTNGVSLYVDGALQARNSILCTNVSSGFDPGRHRSTNEYQINGEISGVRIFSVDSRGCCCRVQSC